MCSVLLCKVRAQNKTWREHKEGRGNTRKHEWNSFHRLQCAGFGMRRPGLTSFTLMPRWEENLSFLSSSCSGWSLTSRWAFFLLYHATAKVVEHQNELYKSRQISICDTVCCMLKRTTDSTLRGFTITHGAAVNCCHAKPLNDSVWVDPDNDPKWPKPTHALRRRGPNENQQGDYHLGL